jgi:hypothetical protein
MADKETDLGPFCSTGMNLDTPIYRIHRKKYLKQLLSGTLYLPTTRSWLDPYENLISWCGYLVIGDDKKINQVFLGNDRLPTFGQCWSKIPESDAMWRIYSDVNEKRELDSFFSDDEGVQLRTTARKLVNALAKGMGKGQANKCYVGLLKYFEEAELRQYVVNAIGTYKEQAFSGVSGHADALLVKRTAFAHESEVRLLYVDADKKCEGKEYIEVPIDVNSVIEEVMLDPRLRNGGGEPKRREWLAVNGFKNTISSSSLYQKLIVQVPLYNPEDLK